MPSQRFPVSHRLVHSHEFDAVFKGNETRLGCSTLLILAKRNQRGLNRLGMVVSKKSVPRAVDRNRVKRRIREVFRRQLAADINGLDVVVLTRTGARNSADLMGLLKRRFGDLAEKASNLP